MVVTTYRPGYRVPWLDRSYLTHIALRPLTAADSAQLVDSVAREQPLPEAVSAAIVEKGEGNPFFLEELARTVVERGADSRAIPDTVQGVIMARVDRLPEVAKHVLQTASVLGREVPLQLLDRVWRGGEYALELGELCRLEFLYEKPGADEPAVIFKHALTQDVAYDSLLARTRRELHLRTAEALAGLYGDRDDLAATFAYHYARTDLVDEAVRWLIRAADRAARCTRMRKRFCTSILPRAGCSGFPRDRTAIGGCWMWRCGTRIRCTSSDGSGKASRCCCRTRPASPVSTSRH